MKHLFIATAISISTFIAIAGGPARAQEENPVLMTLELVKGRLEVTPQGDPAKAFSVDLAQAEMDDHRWVAGNRFAVSEDTLYLDGVVYPRSRLGHMNVQRDKNRVEVIVYDRGENARPLPRRNNETPVGVNLIVKASEFIRGYVLSFGGDVHVEGEVNRSVVCIGGNSYVEPGGVVRGSVVSLGGNVHKADEGTVYGDLYSGNRRTFRPRWFEDQDENVFRFNLAFDYNKVSGALPWVIAEVTPKNDLAPSLKMQVGYAFESELWHYRLGIIRDRARGPFYYAGAYRETLHDDAFRIGNEENLVHALLFRTDYRDYYFAEGFKVESGWSLGRDRRFTLGYHDELVNSLPSHPRLWSLFGGTPFRPNYGPDNFTAAIPLLDGQKSRLAFLRVGGTYHIPYFTDPDEGSWRMGGWAEFSTPGLGSDFNYSRFYAWGSRVQPTWEDQTLRVRASAGGAGGSVPVIRQFFLGGIGTLPGYDYNEFAGDRYWLGSLEYDWNVGTITLFAASDAGQIGVASGWTKSPVLFDAGLGLSIEEALRVQLMWPITDGPRDPLVTFRLSRPF